MNKIAHFRTVLVGGALTAALPISSCSAAPNKMARPESKQKIFLSFDAQAKAVLAKMTLDEKIGQMMQPEQQALRSPQDIQKYFLGSLLSGGGSGPKDPKDYTLTGWTDMVEGYQKQALQTRLHIPLLYGIDALHGNNNIPGAVIFPHNIGLGATRDPALVEKITRITAEEVRCMGANWSFAPCLTVPQDERWGRTYEGYSENPKLVSELGTAAVRGLQGAKLSDPTAVVACIKHWVGDGGTSPGTSVKDTHGGLDQGDTHVDEATLRRIHIFPYISAIQAGAGTIMPSYSSWNGVKMSANKHLLTDVLKHELGFEGFLISDYNALDELGPDYKKDVETSINAGMDMVMLTDKYPVLFQDLKELVAEKKIPMSRINDAVTRILRVKFATGLMDANRSPLPDRRLQKSFGSAAHRAVARQAVRESMVLLKNAGEVLPLAKDATRILIAGRGADSLGMQCGGWTTSWQGSVNNGIPGGTSILTAIKNTVPKDTEVTYSQDGSGAAGHSVAVVVIGEKPYAEFMGDNATLELDPQDVKTVENVKAAGIPVVVVLLSGRPLILDPILGKTDALIAAWLPGSEGQGVADVLFGAKPTGKLSVSWPRSLSQIPINLGDKKYDPLFPYGYGLTYKK